MWDMEQVDIHTRIQQAKSIIPLIVRAIFLNSLTILILVDSDSFT